MRRYVLYLVFAVLLLSFCLLSFAATDIELWQEGSAKIEAGDLQGAAAIFNQLLTDFPTSPKAPASQLELGRIKLQLTPEDTQGLLDAFNLVRTKYPSSTEVADACVHIGYLHSRTDTGQAIKDFEEFLAAHTDHTQCARVTRALGGLHLRNLELDKAEAAFDSVKSASGASTALGDEATMQSAFVKIMRFYTSKDKANLTSAIAMFGGLASASDAKVRGKSELGAAEALLLLGKGAEAHEKYRAAAQTYSNLPYIKGIALYGAAICSKDMQKADQAVAEYDALLDAQAGSTLTDKDAAWKAAALSNLGSRAQAAVQKDGTLGSIPAIDIVEQAAYNKGQCLRIAGKHEQSQGAVYDGCLGFPRH